MTIKNETKYIFFIATIRTYIETCKKHSINIIDSCVRLMNGNPYTLSEILEQNKEQDLVLLLVVPFWL